MILVDTSAWVHQMREKGDAAVRKRVEELLSHGRAAWCAAVRLELWRGVRNDAERRALRRYEALIPDLPITAEIWSDACALASRCRAAGKTAPALDVLIAACARSHGLEVEHVDAHFDFLMTL